MANKERGWGMLAALQNDLDENDDEIFLSSMEEYPEEIISC